MEIAGSCAKNGPTGHARSATDMESREPKEKGASTDNKDENDSRRDGETSLGPHEPLRHSGIQSCHRN